MSLWQKIKQDLELKHLRRHRPADYQKVQDRSSWVFMDFPRSVHINLGNARCTHRCIFCPHHSVQPEESTFIPFELIEKIVAQLPTDRIVNLEISVWGETLLYPDLVRMLSHAKTHRPNSYVVMATNGLLLTPDKARELLATGVDMLSFSMDAPTAESAQALMDLKPEQHQRLVDNLEMLIATRNEMKAPTVISTHMIEMVQTRHEIEGFKARWEGKADIVNIRKLGNWGGLLDDSVATPLWEAPEKRYPCMWMWYATKIYNNGDFQKCFCHFLHEKTALGNLRDTSIRENWHGPNLREVRRLHLEGRYEEIPSCRKCNAWALFPDVWFPRRPTTKDPTLWRLPGLEVIA